MYIAKTKTRNQKRNGRGPNIQHQKPNQNNDHKPPPFKDLKVAIDIAVAKDMVALAPKKGKAAT